MKRYKLKGKGESAGNIANITITGNENTLRRMTGFLKIPKSISGGIIL